MQAGGPRLGFKSAFLYQAGRAALGKVRRVAVESVCEDFKTLPDEAVSERICVTDGPALSMKWD